MLALHDERLEALFGRMPIRALARGEPLFRQGEQASAIFLVLRGRLRMIRTLASGDQVTIHTGRAGELFAEGALFSDTYQCDAVAAETTRVRACGKAEMLTAVRNSPDSMLVLVERLTRLLHHARAMLELRNIRSAEERILQHLRLSSRPGSPNVVVFDRPLSEVAADLGLTHEAYYRALASLARGGAIKRSGRRIQLIAERPGARKS
jgi:CRP-like cAMP-binding protein